MDPLGVTRLIYLRLAVLGLWGENGPRLNLGGQPVNPVNLGNRPNFGALCDPRHTMRLRMIDGVHFLDKTPAIKGFCLPEGRGSKSVRMAQKRAKKRRMVVRVIVERHQLR